MKAALSLLVLTAILCAGCGEEKQVSVYKQGEYSGKADAQPWDSPSYGGDKQKWDQALRQRAQSQNEYVRTH